MNQTDLYSCKTCVHLRRLKHNFKREQGFEESYCCVLFANDKDGFVLETDPNSICEAFCKRKK